LFKALDAITSAPLNRRRLNTETLDLLDETSSLLAESMILGESPYEIEQSSFRASSQRLVPRDSELTISLFQTPVETNFNLPKTNCYLNLPETSNELGVSLVSEKSRNSLDPNITSNPLSLRLSPLRGAGSSIVCSIPNNIPQSYDNTSAKAVHMVSVDCSLDDYGTYYKQCPGRSDGNITVPLSCNGTLSTITQRCPQIESFPDCISSPGDGFDCVKTSYNSTHTQCSCQQSSDRRLSSSANEMALQVLFITLLSTPLLTFRH
jgi:hypothetical protein